MFKFQREYAFISLFLFIVEVVIAVFIHDDFIRPNIGDFLVVILIYCFFKSFLDIAVWKTALSVLLFSYLIEILQYFNYASILGMQEIKVVSIILGSSFSWVDILAYSLGIVLVIGIEKIRVFYQERNQWF